MTMAKKGNCPVRTFSKSKLLALRQCPKRLWLEIHRPDLREDSRAAQARFQIGHAVGEIARRLYDPDGKGVLINVQDEGFEAALKRSAELLGSSQPLFEAGFSSGGGLAFADVMVPAKRGRKRAWKVIEIKSSTSVKDYQRDDAAIQAFVLAGAGVPLASLALAHIDSDWTYPGGDDYRGLLVEHDLTGEALGRVREVEAWIAAARKIAAKRSEPSIRTGTQCASPYECGFLGYCQAQEPQAKYPVVWLSGQKSKALKAHLERPEIIDMRQVPDELLGKMQRRIKQHSLSGKVYFDGSGAAADLEPHGLPGYFLDFETIGFAVPIWNGTRPYQMIPFQFSVHRLSRKGKLESQAFLDLSGDDPSLPLSEALVGACGERGPVYAYNASFEKGRIKELANRFPRLRRSLMAIEGRVVDLHPIVRSRYYHPSQQGSWSIKEVLPSIAPDLDYGKLDGVQEGGMAMGAYREAISAETSAPRKAEIERQLRAYCELDTLAMVRAWQFLAGWQ